MRWTQKSIIVGAMWLLFSSDAGLRANTLYVDQRAMNRSDGSTWPNAFTDLNDALGMAAYGDTILIAQGIYTPDDPNGDPNATFALVRGVTLQGGHAGLDADYPDQCDPNLFWSRVPQRQPPCVWHDCTEYRAGGCVPGWYCNPDG